MKGFRFFAEMPEARESKSGTRRFMPFTRAMLSREADRFPGMPEGRCNVIAVYLNAQGAPLWQGQGDSMDAVVPSMDVGNSPVVLGAGVSRAYLRKRCVRVPEALARKLHPALFRAID